MELDMEKEYAIFGGRFQPLHNGQFWVVKHIIEEEGFLIIGIVNPDPANPPDPNYDTFHEACNPFNYWERLCMIREALRDENLWEKALIVPLWHPRVGIERERPFLADRRVWHVPLVDEWESKKIYDLRRAGEKVRPIVVPNHISRFRSTIVRNKMFLGLEWEDDVPPGVARMIERIHGIRTIEYLYLRYPEFRELASAFRSTPEEERITFSPFTRKPKISKGK